MFSSIKNLFKKNDEKPNKNGLNTPTSMGQTIGGPTKTKPMRTVPKNDPQRTDIPHSNALNSTQTVQIHQNLYSAKAEEIATIFSEGNNFVALENIKNYFKEQQGNVEKQIWFMLMDLLQIFENKPEFDKTSMAFAQYFSTSPPSWFDVKELQKNNISVGSGENMIIFPKIFESSYEEEFKTFLKASRQDHFCRLNISQCRFEQNESDVLNKFLKLLKDLRKLKIPTVLMGDNILLNFVGKFIKDPDLIQDLHPSHLYNPQIIWLAYLELLQWKNNHDDFEIFALKFADKFEISPPGWEDIQNITLENLEKEEDFFVFSEKEITTNNISIITEYLTEQTKKTDLIEIDFSSVERIDFSAAGILSYSIQEIYSLDNNSNKVFRIKNPNEMVLVIFQILGINEIIEIIPRKRT